jgi:hypothetical protein
MGFVPQKCVIGGKLSGFAVRSEAGMRLKQCVEDVDAARECARRSASAAGGSGSFAG